MKRIKYYEVDGQLITNMFILDGGLVYIVIDGFTFSIISISGVLATGTTVDLKSCKKKARQELINLGVVIETEVRNKI